MNPDHKNYKDRDITCSNCGHGQFYQGNWLWDADTTIVECYNCKKQIKIRALISVSYISYCADEEHQWQEDIEERPFVSCLKCGDTKKGKGFDRWCSETIQKIQMDILDDNENKKDV